MNITEGEARECLSLFHAESGIQSSSQAYLTALGRSAVTISGPPSTTSKLLQRYLAEKTQVPLSIFSPYHAPHLFSEADIDELFDHSTRRILEQYHTHGVTYSGSTGLARNPCGTLDLLRSVASELLREPIDITSLLDTAVSGLSPFELETNIMAVGVGNITNSIVTALNAGGHKMINVLDHTSWSCQENQGMYRTQSDKIAIIGMSGRFPSAANHDALWGLLMAGLDVHKEITSDRFDAQAHYDPSGKGRNKSHTKFACLIDEPGLFDPRFFNMSPREATQTDPMGRLALVTGYEALEMSGYVPGRTPSTRPHKVGCFYGQTSDDWREINAAEHIDTYFITGGVRAFAPGRINYYFKFSGPSFSVDTACSSSLAAIQLACTSLWAGDLDMACAGGLNVLTNPDIFSGLSKGQFLSKTGNCKTYDHDADGYCRGESPDDAR